MKATHFYIAILILLIFSNCERPEEGIDPAFTEYVDLFIQEAADRGETYEYSDVRSLRFDDIEESTVNGYCRYSSNDVTIDRENWDKASESSRTELIFHELGHCILNRRHTSDEYLSGVCTSIMAGGDDASCIKGFNNWYENDKVVLSLGEQRFFISKEIIYLTDIFIDRDPELEETMTMRFVQYDGLDYFFVDDEMFHMDNLDLDFTSLSVAGEKINVQNVLKNVCPNCGGGFEKRPSRPQRFLEKYPPRKDKVFKPVKENQYLKRNIDLHPRKR